MLAADLPAIELQGLVKHYGKVRALDGVSLRVNRGEIFGFLGPNGAGKTTAIRVLFDLIRPTSGSASVSGFDCQRQSLLARKSMGYLSGELRLYENLTGQQTIELFQSLRPNSTNHGYAQTLAERLGLDTSRVVKTYSKGNRQKLGLTLAMMHRPQVLVLDEPTSGLDPLVQDEVVALLSEASAEGRTVFFSSHVLPEVARMCHRAAVLRDGKLVAIEEVVNLKAKSLHELEVKFDGEVSAEEFSFPGVRVTEHRGTSIRLEVSDNLDSVLKAITTHKVIDLRTEQPSLEQVFRAHYEGGEPADDVTEPS